MRLCSGCRQTQWGPLPSGLTRQNLHVKVLPRDCKRQGIHRSRTRLSLVGDLRKVSVQDAKFQKLSALLSV